MVHSGLYPAQLSYHHDATAVPSAAMMMWWMSKLVCETPAQESEPAVVRQITDPAWQRRTFP